MAYIGPKACHDPFQPGPWYKDTCEARCRHAPRTHPRQRLTGAATEHHPTILRAARLSETRRRPASTRSFKDRWRTHAFGNEKIAVFSSQCFLAFCPSLSWQNIGCTRTQNINRPFQSIRRWMTSSRRSENASFSRHFI